ncbi:cell growth-regulating nucleolar protein isoform X2 [Venturia canescens]|uniref:cell growth-regulating nucleolar protein isoform X2 n=1 Tax=Venturia canescens TaxID=32260 RepID=UPI001C9BD55F|nr:cell growth-regulating nucleolar protein isoform X2 [Venturia canescens]
MVVFTCNNCGDSLQKPKVAKHYQFQCRSSENLTCVDCHKDFYGQEYVSHTKCITESERYGGQDYVPKPGQNKGERKQQEWINIVKNVIETAKNLTMEERNILNILSRHENIPRKKAKFLNFIRSVMGNRINMPVIDGIWARMETAFKGAVEANKPQGQSTNVGNHENNIAENQNNENISREKGLPTENGTEIPEVVEKKKKTKKRDLTETEVTPVEEPPKKKRKKKSSEEVVEGTTVMSMDQNDNQETLKFDWKAAILEIIGSNQEISLKKLRKKVCNRYVNHRDNSITFEKAVSKFEKKLSKVTEVSINDNKVRLL